MKNGTVLFVFFITILHPLSLAQDSSASQVHPNSVSAIPVKINTHCGTLTGYDFKSEMITSTTQRPISTMAYIEKTPMLANQDGILLKYTLNNLTFDGLSLKQKMELTKTISNTLYVFQKSDGTILEIYGAGDVPLWNYNALKSIVLGLQVIQPEIDRSIKTYQIEEKDDKGVVVADYEIASNQLIKKHRQSYKTLWNEGASINLENSSILINLNDEGLIKDIKMQERISIGSQQSPLFSSDYHQQFSLKEIRPLSSTADKPCPYLSLAEVREKEQLVQLSFANVTNQDMLRQQKLQQLKNVNLDDLVNNLLPKDGKIEKPAAVVASLIDLFTYYPSNLSKVPDLLEKHALDPQFSSYLIASVAQVQTIESQAILLDIMKRFNSNNEILMQAILAHHSVLTPSPVNADYLVSLHKASDNQEFKNLVILVIGSLSSRLDAIRPDQQPHPLTDFIIGELTRNTQELIPFAVIDAVGNSGDVYAFSALRKIIETERNPELIGKAIKAIRKMPLEKVNPLLVEMLNNNHDNKNATLSALLALQNRQLNDDVAIQKIINDYPSYSIELKLEALTLLSEKQIAGKILVSKFIDGWQYNKKFSDAEIKIIISRFVR